VAERSLRVRGPWQLAEIERFLGETRVPLRLASNGARGHPLITSLWFTWQGGRLWCATQARSRIAALLAHDPRCAFEVAPDAPPYRGVRGSAIATLWPERGACVLGGLIDRYLGDRTTSLARWLLARSESELAIALSPRTLTSWDYSARMGTP
jgi:hypothetical protein